MEEEEELSERRHIALSTYESYPSTDVDASLPILPFPICLL
jgi:hypothetical protein